MNVIDAIKSRRSIGKVKDAEVPKEVIEKIIEAAVWAPNRFLTHPWRFFVISGEGRRALGNVLVQIAVDEGVNPESEEGKKKLEKELHKPFRAPVIIAVAAKVAEGGRVIRLEELGAVAAGIQNMLLAAHELGIGAYWRTGTACYSSRMKSFFGLEEKDEVLALIYIGYPEQDKKDAARRDPKELTTWIDSDK